MLLLLLLTSFATLLLYFYFKKTNNLEFWKQRGFPTLETRPHLLFGDFYQSLVGKKSFIYAYQEAHLEFKKRGHKLGGMYLLSLPIVLVTDHEIMKRMLQSDFDAFADRGITVDPVNNPLSMHLFSLGGEQWRIIRKKLSPTFTSGKVKLMFPIIERHIDILIKVTRKMCKAGGDVDYHEWLDKTGVDVIGHIAFGIDCNTLEGENEKFFEMTHRIMRPKIWKVMKLLLFHLKNPADIISLVSSDKELSNFFINLIQDTIAHRRKNEIKSHDFLQVLIEMVEEEERKTGSGLTMLEVAAQAFAYFVAGYETIARTVLFALYALAHAQDEQNCLRESIKKDLDAMNGLYDYDWIVRNERLDLVIKETLRLYSPVITLNRMATRDYKVDELGLTIPKNTCVVFSLFGFHQDPDYFDEPSEFRPDRFSKENADRIEPFTYVPFGDGPRYCIGKNIGVMQSKMTLAKILMNFEVKPSEKTEYPLRISSFTTTLLMSPENPLLFRFKPI